MTSRTTVLLAFLVLPTLAQAQKCAVVLPMGSPVWISQEVRHVIRGAGIAVRNRSDRPITAITIEVRRKNPGKEDSVSIERVPIVLGPSETGHGVVPLGRVVPKTDVTLTVLVSRL